MQHYHLLEREIAEDDPGLAGLLAQAHGQRERAICLCRRDHKLPLYIAHRQGGYVLARWPGTGPRHASACNHYEAPDFLTGLGQVRGSAVVEHEDSGETELKFAFPLSRGPARAAPSAFTNDKPAVRTNGLRLTMQGLLHFLWDKAELTHWHPRMGASATGSWSGRRCSMPGLLQGARRKPGARAVRARDVPARTEGRHRRAPAFGPRDGACLEEAIMVVIGEIKAIEPARFGEKIVVRHLPDWPFLMDEDMARRFHKRFAVEEELWRSDGGGGHLVMSATFSIGASGLPQLFEIAVMPVTREWMPYESLDERALVSKAVGEGRRFVKGLRVNLDRTNRSPVSRSRIPGLMRLRCILSATCPIPPTTTRSPR
jgi:hypothetical protein